MAAIFGNKQDDQHQAKRAVAEWVWENVIRPDRNPRLIIDAGSSAQAVAEVIAERVGDQADDADFSWLTVLTHNLGAWEALSTLRQGLDLFLVDGRYDGRLNANITPTTIGETLGDFNPSVVVVAASGLDADGLYCSAVQDERPVKAALTSRKTTTRIIVADHTKIGLTDVQEVCHASHLHSMFVLSDAMGAGHVVQALSVINALLHQGEPPLVIFSMIVRHVRLLWSIQQLARQRSQVASIAKTLRLPQRVCHQLVAQSRLYTPERLRQLYAAAVEADLAFKTSNKPAKAILESLVLEVCSGS